MHQRSEEPTLPSHLHSDTAWHRPWAGREMNGGRKALLKKGSAGWVAILSASMSISYKYATVIFSILQFLFLHWKKKEVNQLPIRRATNRAAVKGLNNSGHPVEIAAGSCPGKSNRCYVHISSLSIIVPRVIIVAWRWKAEPEESQTFRASSILTLLAQPPPGPRTPYTHRHLKPLSSTGGKCQPWDSQSHLGQAPSWSCGSRTKAQSNHRELDFISYHEHPTCYCWCTDNLFKSQWTSSTHLRCHLLISTRNFILCI